MNQALDIKVTQQGDIYTVSGKDAPTLYDKLQKIPEETRTLIPGELKDGAFTLKKAAVAQPASASA